MAAQPPSSPPISPDGHYWWDGQAWQPMPAAAAPIPAPAPAAEAAPSWLAVQPQAPAPQAPVYQQPAYAPEPVYQQPAYDQPPAGAPAWATPAPPSNRLWIYMTGLLLIVVIGIG